jgi:hypothetical protein
MHERAGKEGWVANLGTVLKLGRWCTGQCPPHAMQMTRRAMVVEGF